jgi:hypothetical protein
MDAVGAADVASQLEQNRVAVLCSRARRQLSSLHGVGDMVIVVRVVMVVMVVMLDDVVETCFDVAVVAAASELSDDVDRPLEDEELELVDAVERSVRDEKIEQTQKQAQAQNSSKDGNARAGADAEELKDSRATIVAEAEELKDDDSILMVCC